MSRRPVRQLLDDMLERIERIGRHVSGLDRTSFLCDEKTSDAVVRNLEVLGEAASRLPADFRDGHPIIPWGRLVGLRNRVVHACFDVDIELVWEILHRELPDLERSLRRLSTELRGDEWSS